MLKVYGDMVYLSAFGQGVLVLGSLSRTNDLFERRSSNYSDRPKSTMLVDLMGWGINVGSQPYGSWWRRHRRVFHEFFHPNAVKTQQPVQLTAARTFIRNLFKSPDDFSKCISFAFASTIMEVVYDIKVEGLDNQYIKTAQEAVEGFADAAMPGRYLVDTFPIMKYIPSWFPGAGWKRKANRGRHVIQKVCDGPFYLVKEQIQAGTATPSMATTLIEKLSDRDPSDRNEEETIAVNVCAIAYVGGSDTTVSALRTFFMAMCLYPEAQRKGQAELDTVLKGRLPEFDDRPSLPYINAIVKETLRWQPVTPLGVAHMTTHADEYDGYYIPKGTIVMGNAWTILHDPEVYRDPHEYIPDRFIKDGELNRAVRDPSIAFGFGRRICPGRFFSDNNMFALIAHVLTVYDIKPTLDGAGKEIRLTPDVTGGVITQPVPFSCRIIPRSKAAIDLIHQSESTE
ncbi:cytochrome P450 [Macrolepiota fuliginosa MF-IS2]|uniref:Cytochrome P450 n=1 Tax=Macrolepiota fuliginosa MF-IS2 TaxID=1400762 RepID=A0A9P5X780_9AGAR|nr:cytochrome P450 [Macrolepiota fuliginosa MF-IS2]